MKSELNCSIVQDLLSNYIERITSDETSLAVEEHLNSCKECQEAYEQRIADSSNSEKTPIKKLRFLKKIKKTRILAAALSVVLTLLLSYLIYASEYKFTNDKEDLSTAITEYTSPFKHAVDAYVLETKEIDGVLFASFKDQSDADIYGLAVLMKGFNQRYRIVRAKIESSDYSAVLQIYPIKIKNNQYYAVSGYNISDEIKYYGLDYYAYSNPGYLSEDRVRKSVKFDVKNQQFLETYHAEELESLFLENYAEETLYNLHLVTTSMYDADGMEITEDFRNQEDINDRVSSGIGKVELFMLYVYIAIVIGLGYIFTRYFLTVVAKSG